MNSGHDNGLSDALLIHALSKNNNSGSTSGGSVNSVLPVNIIVAELQTQFLFDKFSARDGIFNHRILSSTQLLALIIGALLASLLASG